MSEITFSKLFWLFMFGNVLGVIVEGVWCKLRHGKWETHTVAIWGPFNIVYGIGIPVFYVGSILFEGFQWLSKFAIFALLGSFVEYLCGIVIRIGLRMKAWDYSKHFLNIQGLISLRMVLLWGVVGSGFHLLLFEPLKKLLFLMNGVLFDMVRVGLTVFMAVNLSLTAACIIRWANRHKGKLPSNRLTKWIDRTYPDSKMQKKFFYWSFIDDDIAVNRR